MLSNADFSQVFHCSSSRSDQAGTIYYDNGVKKTLSSNPLNNQEIFRCYLSQVCRSIEEKLLDEPLADWNIFTSFSIFGVLVNNNNNNNQYREISNIWPSYQLLVHVSPWLRLVHVTPASHVSARKWHRKWPHCEYFLLSLPTRAGGAGGASTLGITPTLNINMAQSSGPFSHLKKSVITVHRGGGLVSVCNPIKIFMRNNKGLADTRGVHFSHFLFTLGSSLSQSVKDCVTTVISLSRGIKQLAVCQPSPLHSDILFSLNLMII